MSFMLLGILNAQTSGGGGAAYELLESVTLSSPASSVTFSGLDSYSNYKSLQIRMVTRFDTQGFAYQYMNFNGDQTSGNYSSHRLNGGNSSINSGNNLNEDYIRISETDRLTDSTAGAFGASIIDIYDFASTTKTTTARSLFGRIGATNTASNKVGINSGMWNNTDAVTSISFGLPTVGYVNYVTGSRFSLIGVR